MSLATLQAPIDRNDSGIELVVKILAQRFGERFSAAAAVREQHGHTTTWLPNQAPDGVVFAHSTEEVATVVGICAEHRVPIIPFGTGSSLEGHVNAPAGGISIDLSQMKAVRVDKGAQRAVVEAINNVRKRPPPQRADAQTEAKPAAETPRKWNAAAHILGCLLCDASLWHALGDEERTAIAPQSFADASLERLARTLQTMTDTANPPDLASILDALDDEIARTTAVALYREVSSATEHQSHRLHEHWRACLARVAQDRPAPDTELSPQQRLEELRTLHGKLPVDRRRMPRPTESISAPPPTSGR